VNKDRDRLAKLCTEAVLSVSDLKSNQVFLDMVHFELKEGDTIFDSKLIRGVLLKKSISHDSMPKNLKNCKIAIISFPLEPQKPKMKYSVNITTIEEFNSLKEFEKTSVVSIVSQLKAKKVDLLVSQWGFDHYTSNLLHQNGITAIKWVSGNDFCI
jgi:T-complex protein 1 subunit epsilon